MNTGAKRAVLDRLVADGPDDAVTLHTRLEALLREEAPLLSREAFDALLSELAATVTGSGALEPILADPNVTDLMLNGPGRVFVERRGIVEPLAIELDAADIRRLVERAITPLGLRLDRAAPIVEARLADGSRLHAVIEPVALDGPYVTIRRLPAAGIPLHGFEMPDGGDRYLRDAVASRAGIVVSGGTGAGKTTLLGALAAHVGRGERIITIEETAELRVDVPHLLRLEARPPNAEGAGAVGVRDLVRAALRMRPDRLVIGEVRGAEAFDLLQAANTGHDGVLSTVHADSASDALVRLEALTLLAGTGLPLGAVRRQWRRAVDVIVHVARGPGSRRRVVEIAEVAREGVRLRHGLGRSR